jgi:hypothetical protein
MSFTPRHLSPKLRRAFGEQRPRLDLHRELAAPGSNDLAFDADPVTEIQPDELAKRSVTASVAKSWIAPLQSRSSANATLPCGRFRISRPATRTVTPLPFAGEKSRHGRRRPLPAATVPGKE